LLLGAKSYYSEFLQEEKFNEMLLALNLLWAGNCCRRYDTARRLHTDLDWENVRVECTEIQTAFAKTQPNAADWLEYIHRSGR